MNLRNYIKKIVPAKILKTFNPFYRIVNTILFKHELDKLAKKQIELLKKIRLKNKINVVFLVIHDSIWKFEEVYRLLENNPKFDVKIVVIPLVRNNEGQMNNYYQTLNFFKNGQYNAFGSFDKKNKCWLDIKAIIKPDVVFFTNPHKLTFDKYYITNFKDTLTCYSPYAFVVIHSISMHYNQPFQHFLWKHFVETNKHKKFSDSFKLRRISNSIVTGFPGLDSIFNEKFKPKSPWKEIDKKTIKIIWAPHHTIKGQGSGLDYSSFNYYFDFFMKYLETNKNVQIAFKPHPLLKEKLYKDEAWGKEKTDEYYNEWNKMPNGQLEEGGYIDLFHHSDAMILDSASFIAEYLYFDKPLLFTKIDDNILERFNSFGQKIFCFMYQAKNEKEIETFILETVIKGNDILKDSRNRFLKQDILPENGKTASENIYRDLIKELCWRKIK